MIEQELYRECIQRNLERVDRLEIIIDKLHAVMVFYRKNRNVEMVAFYKNRIAKATSIRYGLEQEIHDCKRSLGII